MNKLLDRLILLLFCTLILLTSRFDEFSALYIVAAVAFAAAEHSLSSESASLLISILALSGSLFFPDFFYCAPLIMYGLFKGRFRWAALLALLPFIMHWTSTPVWGIAIPALFLLSAYLSFYTTQGENRILENNILRDLNAEKQRALEKTNQELMEQRDYEVHAAMLEERNRIARELHDSIGHVLTSSLLQTGALIATCTDSSMKGPLNDLKKSLSDGMNQVRASIHDVYEDSEDFYSSVQALLRDFSFCPVKLLYNLNTTPKRLIRNAFIAVIKESLSNIARHSDASHAVVSLREHPGMFQLSIRDNGTDTGAFAEEIEKSKGIGLIGIEERVEKLRGNVVFRKEKGFEIFISVPKEDA